MTYSKKKDLFEKNWKQVENALLSFEGVEDYDVYNASVPFVHDGQTYLFGRVERREEWAKSHVRLFIRTGVDQYTAVSNSMIYPLEDPYISRIRGEMVLGGTHVVYEGGEMARLYAYFYQGAKPWDLRYFTTGPLNMKDIRLVEMERGIGVFSRPKGRHIVEEYGSESVVGYTEIFDLRELTPERIGSAVVIPDMFGPGEWGGCNQCYLLDTGLIGIIGHKSYTRQTEGILILSVYVNVSFVFDPWKHSIIDERIIATRASYPMAPAKIPELADCAFTSGIVQRKDGKLNLYSGLGDTCQGRVVIDNPFEGYGSLIRANL